MKKKKLPKVSPSPSQCGLETPSGIQSLLLFLFLIAVVGGIYLFIYRPAPSKIENWVKHPKKIPSLDIALMNLECAKGLNGTEDLNIPETLEMLDQWAAQIKKRTDQLMGRFYVNPENYNHSEAYFRMLAFVSILQSDYSVRYKEDSLFRLDNPSLPDELFFKDAKDIFIHGIMEKARQGTCASLPVLYVSLGRRMGYPLYLVPAKKHLFLRWDDGKERINIEATTEGFG